MRIGSLLARIGALCLLGGLLIDGVVMAQDSTLVFDNVGVHRDTIDTFQPQSYTLRPLIVPGTETIWVGHTRLDTTEYRLDADRGKLWVHRDDLIGARDTLFAAYRTLPLTFESVYRRRAPDSSAADSGAVAIVEEDSVRQRGFSPFEGVDIQRSGSISRGIVSGTNRDANVESGMRMQLKGEVAEGVHVRAMLTDENTPIQPGGSTQRLRDFDRVFLGIQTPHGDARLGDVDVDLGAGTFGQFNQKVQGVMLESSGLGSSVGLTKGKATVMGAVSRGPYRLRGRNGDPRLSVGASNLLRIDPTRLLVSPCGGDFEPTGHLHQM